MANTTNFNWETPDDTDLVKDGAAAIRTLGSAIDTSLVDLKGGTTGQILSKATNTDMDFTWITNDVGDITAVSAGTGITGGGTTGAITITNDMATTITASGDIVVGTGSGTYDNLPIGTTGQILTADTTVSPYKVKWATPAGGSGFTLINATSFSAVSSQSLNNVFTSTYRNYKVIVNITSSSTASGIRFRLRASGADDTTTNYTYALVRYLSGSATLSNYDRAQSGSFINIGEVAGFSESGFIEFTVGNPQLSQNTTLNGSAGNQTDFFVNSGIFTTTTVFDGFSIIAAAGNITGAVAVYGLAI